MMNGVSPASFYILPMLGEKHPEEYPRFRDCFVDTENEQPEIHLYTRVGGGNREDYEEQIEELRKHPNYLRDFDDDFDNTFATFAFSVPEEFKEDFEKIIGGRPKEISDAYLNRLKASLPKLAERFQSDFR